jgi:ergothioneine biosynthesis protein EgtB
MVAAREESDQLFQLVRPDSMYARPIPERHRIVFYLGHVEAFDWNLLQPRLAGLKSFDGTLDRLFAFGIDPLDGGLPSDQVADWPSRQQVAQYNHSVRARLDDALHSGGWAGDESPSRLLNVAIEHRLMHVETLAYMLHQLPLDRKVREHQPDAPAANGLSAGMVEITAGRATLGADGGTFGWDNEFHAQIVDVPSFSIGRYKVTNGQYLAFVRAGGYQQRSLWADPAWRWKEQEGIEHPVFWRAAGDRWLLRTMFDEIPLPVDWPVYVSHAEAGAYTAWAGKRLPSEVEWHRAAFGDPSGEERDFPWGAQTPAPEHGNFALRRWDPAAVHAFPSSRSAFGVEGMLANGWEWTSSLFEPFPGFEPFPFYQGYSANFFDGMHYVMKGGSPRTEQCMLRRSFRNWFQPHYQYVYAGFRCAT